MFKCDQQRYYLYNKEPFLGTWLKVSQPVPLKVGMIFKVGTDEVEGLSSKVDGMNVKKLYLSCFKVNSSGVNRYSKEKICSRVCVMSSYDKHMIWNCDLLMSSARMTQ